MTVKTGLCQPDEGALKTVFTMLRLVCACAFLVIPVHFPYFEKAPEYVIDSVGFCSRLQR